LGSIDCEQWHKKPVQYFPIQTHGIAFEHKRWRERSKNWSHG